MAAFTSRSARTQLRGSPGTNRVSSSLASKVEWMQARVTAVLVAHNGAERLPRTLAALRAQTRQPDSLVVVDAASSDNTAKLLTEMQPTGFLAASTRLTFGVAVSHALGVVPPPASDDEWLWLFAPYRRA